jgi:hypothetical protein
MENKRIKIKYHQDYDLRLGEKLSEAAIALGGEFSDCAVGDGAREMSFKFENVENLRKFFQILKGLLAQKEEDQHKSRRMV